MTRGNKCKVALLSSAALIAVLFFASTITNGYQAANQINQVLRHFANRENSPIYWDTSEMPWTKVLRDNYQIINNELKNYEKNCQIPKYRYLSKQQSFLDHDYHAAWRALYIINKFIESSFARHYFPETLKVLNSVPGLSTAFFSILDPWTKLDDHYGVYEGVMRYHLGLSVPENATDCFIAVAGERRHWTNGGDLVFDDNLLHGVENNTPQRRVVLFVDFRRDYSSPVLNLVNRLVIWGSSFNIDVRDIIRMQNRYHDQHCIPEPTSAS